jgi:hypothetical protein
LFITADDFGLSAEANDAIAPALAQGVVTHACLLVNGAAAAAACDLARPHAAEGCIGLHFNMSEGVPLSAAARDSATFCRDGRFRPVEEFPRYRLLDAGERATIAEELRAQLAAMARFGIQPGHLDSHNDIHREPSIASIVVAVAAEAGVRRIRISRNCGERQGFVRRLQYRGFNFWLARRGFRMVDYCGLAEDIEWLAMRGRLPRVARVEVVTHPRLDRRGTILDAPSDEPLQARVAKVRELVGT